MSHISLDQLRAKAAHNLAMNHPHAWAVVKHEEKKLEHFVHESEEMAAATALTGALIMGTTPADALLENYLNENISQEQVLEVSKPTVPQTTILQQSIRRFLPANPQKLSPQISTQVTRQIAKITDIKTTSTLDGKTLNTDYGYMGAEQHLPRFPGDTVEQHSNYKASGITQRLGAFGYFASSEDDMSDEDIQREKYYVAVQSFLAPQWDGSGMQYKDWIKYRKVMVINPTNGKAVVASVGDAGPAVWTGKQFGGSPEVVHELNNGNYSHKTPVLLFFIDDKENAVPLGPIN